MNISETRRFDVVQRDLLVYGEVAASETWKLDHHLAMVCFDFAELVLKGVHVYESISRLDNDWRLCVYAGEMEYDEQLEQRTADLYQEWLGTSVRVLGLYKRLESEYISRGFDTEPVDRLSAACREVQACLVLDEEFFKHEKLAELRDQAIEAYRRGETVEMEELGD